jgi:hypothetical protein
MTGTLVFIHYASMRGVNGIMNKPRAIHQGSKPRQMWTRLMLMGLFLTTTNDPHSCIALTHTYHIVSQKPYPTVYTRTWRPADSPPQIIRLVRWEVHELLASTSPPASKPAAQSTSPQTNKPHTNSTRIWADAGNALCYYARIPCISVNCSQLTAEVPLRKFFLTSDDPVCPNLFTKARVLIAPPIHNCNIFKFMAETSPYFSHWYRTWTLNTTCNSRVSFRHKK